MAVVVVSISSHCTIKPSSATPPHLRTWNLSMLDQCYPHVNIPIIPFYRQSPSHPPAAIVAHLKQSLSHVLTKFYPLAGRFDELTSTVDCGDQGVDFLEAQVHGVDLAGFLLQKPEPDLLRQLVPQAGATTTACPGGGMLLAVQATVFNCGGVSIGLCISHKIADGVSVLSFFQSWTASATTRDGDVILESSYFPPLESLKPALNFIATESMVQRRFVLDQPQLTALQSANRLVGTTDFPKRTRVELITALFWPAIIRARSSLGPAGKGLMLHMVNLRNQIAAPEAETILGNFAFPIILTEEEGVEGSLRRLSLKLVNAVRELNNEKLQVFIMKSFEEMVRLPMRCLFSGLCSLPIYDVDFGWGKPVWVAFGGPAIQNSVFMFNTKDGQGAEVWVSLEQEEMERLVTDEELLSHISLF